MIVSANRTSRIVVLKDGRIVEQGTHAELIARGGVFAEMWADQVSTTDEASAHRKSAVVTGFDLENGQQDAPTLVSEEPVQLLGTEEVAQDKLADNEAEGATEETAAPVAFPASDAAEEAPETAKAPTDSAVAAPVAEDRKARVELLGGLRLRGRGGRAVRRRLRLDGRRRLGVLCELLGEGRRVCA